MLGANEEQDLYTLQRMVAEKKKKEKLEQISAQFNQERHTLIRQSNPQATYFEDAEEEYQKILEEEEKIERRLEKPPSPESSELEAIDEQLDEGETELELRLRNRFASRKGETYSLTDDLLRAHEIQRIRQEKRMERERLRQKKLQEKKKRRLDSDSPAFLRDKIRLYEE